MLGGNGQDVRAYRASDCRTADGLALAQVDARPSDEAGVYLTDEIFLFRVVGMVSSPAGEIVELEDCYRLDIVCVPLSDLRARRFRVVTPAPVRG